MIRKFWLLFLVTICVTVFSACGSNGEGDSAPRGRGTQAFDVLSHLSVNFSGVEGSGTANVAVIDSNAMEMEMMQAAGFALTGTPADTEHLAEFLTLAAAIDWSVYPATNLSNGDSVTVTVSVNQDTLSRHNMRVANLTRQHTVAGLGELPNVSILDDGDVLHYLVASAQNLSESIFDLETNIAHVVGAFRTATHNSDIYGFFITQQQIEEQMNMSVTLRPIYAHTLFNSEQSTTDAFIVLAVTSDVIRTNLTGEVLYSLDTAYGAVMFSNIVVENGTVNFDNAGFARTSSQGMANEGETQLYGDMDEMFRNVIDSRMRLPRRTDFCPYTVLNSHPLQ